MDWIVVDTITLAGGRAVKVTRAPNGMARRYPHAAHAYATREEAEEVAKEFGSVAVPMSSHFIRPAPPVEEE